MTCGMYEWFLWVGTCGMYVEYLCIAVLNYVLDRLFWANDLWYGLCMANDLWYGLCRILWMVYMYKTGTEEFLVLSVVFAFFKCSICLLILLHFLIIVLHYVW